MNGNTHTTSGYVLVDRKIEILKLNTSCWLAGWLTGRIENAMLIHECSGFK